MWTSKHRLSVNTDDMFKQAVHRVDEIKVY